MSHYIQHINPEAHERIVNPVPLPAVGMPVTYHPRAGEMRQRRSVVAALVTGRDEANELLDLVVVFDADDFISQRRIPRWNGTDRGWEPVDGLGQQAMAKLEAFKAELSDVLFGSNSKPDLDITTRLDKLEERLDAVESKRAIVHASLKANHAAAVETAAIKAADAAEAKRKSKFARG